MDIVKSFSAILFVGLMSFWTLNSQAAGPNDVTIAVSDTGEVKVKITGMHCGGCCSSIIMTLMETDGIFSNDLEWPGDVANIKYDPVVIKEKEVVKVIKKMGYTVEVLEIDQLSR